MTDLSNSRKAMNHLINCIAGDDPDNIPNDINWRDVIELAKIHKVIPALHQNTKDHLPQADQASLHKSFLANATKNAFIAEELLHLLALLRSHDITAVPFKGPTLALQAHSDLSMRQFDDIDLIIPDDHILRTVKILEELDYRPDIKLPGSAEKGYLKSRQDWTLHTQKSNICLDIKPASAFHASFSNSPLTEILYRQDALSNENTELNCLTPEDTLEAICVHGARHLWHRLSWIQDVSALAHKLGESGIRVAITSAQKQGTLRRLLLGLNLAKEVLETDIPKSINDMIDYDPAIKSLTDISINALYNHPANTMGPGNWMFQMKSMERTSDKLRALIRYIFVPSKVEFSIIALPSCAYPLYHIIRPIRLLWELSQKVAKKAKRKSR